MTKPDDYIAGHYTAAATVKSTRRDLFFLGPQNARLIATLVSGSATKIAQFDADCERIVKALALLDAAEAEHAKAEGEGGKPDTQ